MGKILEKYVKIIFIKSWSLIFLSWGLLYILLTVHFGALFNVEKTLKKYVSHQNGNNWCLLGSGWWYTYPSEKWWSSSVGMMKFPTEWKNNRNVPNHQPGIKPTVWIVTRSRSPTKMATNSYDDEVCWIGRPGIMIEPHRIIKYCLKPWHGKVEHMYYMYYMYYMHYMYYVYYMYYMYYMYCIVLYSSLFYSIVLYGMVCLYVCLYVCLSVCMSVCLSVCMYVCM